jgi:hypothetical protein
MSFARKLLILAVLAVPAAALAANEMTGGGCYLSWCPLC